MITHVQALSEDFITAVTVRDYGGPEVLKIEQVARPVPNDDQVLIKVRAASVNPLDWHTMRGDPYVMRLGSGFSTPKEPRLGADLAGEVVAVGANVTTLKPGDAVFGTGLGAFGEYAVTRPLRLAPKPDAVSYEDTAAIPVAGLTALQALRDHGKVTPGMRVLINGASGGVGTFAVQIAKAMGAHVTGVCSTRNVELVTSLGADRVIDYTKDDFAAGSETYDVVFDLVGNRSISELRSITADNGIVILSGGGSPDEGGLLGPLTGTVWALITSPFVSQRLGVPLADVTTEDLTIIGEMIAAKKIKPVIDRTYPLIETAAAIAYIESGRARGKVILDVAEDDDAVIGP